MLQLNACSPHRLQFCTHGRGTPVLLTSLAACARTWASNFASCRTLEVVGRGLLVLNLAIDACSREDLQGAYFNCIMRGSSAGSHKARIANILPRTKRSSKSVGNSPWWYTACRHPILRTRRLGWTSCRLAPTARVAACMEGARCQSRE